MLNEKRIILVAPSSVIEELHYEGLQKAEMITDYLKIWSNNKTPVIEEGSLMHQYAKDMCYPLVQISPNFSDEIYEYGRVHSFEPGEKLSETKYDTKQDDCFLCKTVKEIKSDLKKFNTFCSDHEMVIYNSENFFIKIELGCLIPGMVMINPKVHYLSAALIPEEILSEYELVKSDIEFILSSIYQNQIIFFEHGSAADGLSSHKRSIVHAHTHVAPGVFEQCYIDAVKLKPSSLSELKGKKYLSYQEGANGLFLAVSDPEVYVQRQYPRQVIAKMHSIPNRLSNWRVEPFIENIIQTYRDMYSFLKKNSTFLCERIQVSTKDFVEACELRKDIL